MDKEEVFEFIDLEIKRLVMEIKRFKKIREVIADYLFDEKDETVTD